MNVPDSDFPFEFNYDKGSIVTDHNVLTESVSNDGKTVYKVNSPQPIKKYKKYTSNNSGNTNQQNDRGKKQQQQKQDNNNSYSYSYHYNIPTGSNKVNMYNKPFNQWEYFENLSRFVDGRIDYILDKNVFMNPGDIKKKLHFPIDKSTHDIIITISILFILDTVI